MSARTGVKVTMMDFGIYASKGDFQSQLDLAFAEFQEFCSTRHLKLHMVRFSRTLLGFASSAEFPTAIPDSMYTYVPFFVLHI